MHTEIETLLAELEASVEALEDVRSEEHWTFDDVSANEEQTVARKTKLSDEASVQEPNHSNRYLSLERKRQKILRDRKREATAWPSVGSYDPSYRAVQKRTISVKMTSQKTIPLQPSERKRKFKSIKSTSINSSSLSSPSSACSSLRLEMDENTESFSNNASTSRKEVKPDGWAMDASQRTVEESEDVLHSLLNSSRCRRTPSIPFSKSGLDNMSGNKFESRSERRAKKIRAQRKLSDTTPPIGAYQVSYKAVEKTARAALFAPRVSTTEQLGRVKADNQQDEHKDEEEQQDADDSNDEVELDVEKAFAAVEPRVKGVCSWAPVSSKNDAYTRQRLPEQEKEAQENDGDDDDNDSVGVDLDTQKAFKATLPKVHGATAWVLPYYSKKEPDPVVPTPQQVETLTERKRETFVVPSSSFAPESQPSNQLQRHRKKQSLYEAKLGPGAYLGSEAMSTFRKKTERDTRHRHQDQDKTQVERKLRVAQIQKEKEKKPDVGQYSIDQAVQATRPRIKCGVSMAKNTVKRFPSPKQVSDINHHELEQHEDPLKEQHAQQKPLETRESEDPQQSSGETDTSEDEGKEEERDDMEEKSSRHRTRSRHQRESKYSEAKYQGHSDSESESENETEKYAEMEDLAMWLKSVRYKNKKPFLPEECLQRKWREAEPVEQKPSTWARKSFLDTADAKRYLILQKHLQKKHQDKLGPNELYAPNHQATQVRLAKGTISIATAEETRKRQEQQNQAIQKKIEERNKSKEKKILEKLGIDEELLQSEAFDRATYSSFAQAKGFQYHPPTELPEPVQRVRQEREELSSKRGPGAYYDSTRENAFNVEDAQLVAQLISTIRDAKAEIETFQSAEVEDGPTNNVLVLEAKSKLRDAQAALERVRQRESMSKVPGRDKKKIKHKGLEKTVAFSDAAFHVIDESLNELGPGQYDVHNNVTRYGVEKAKGPAFDKMAGRQAWDDDDEEDGCDNPVLDLDTEQAFERVKASAPGTRGFRFDSFKTARDCNKETEEDTREVLEPNYEFGKFFEPGKNIIPMVKSLGRPTQANEKDDIESEERVELSPTRAKDYLGPRVKGLVELSRGVPRDLFPTEQDDIEFEQKYQEAYHDAVYEPNIDAVKPRQGKGVPEFDRGLERFGGDEFLPPTAGDEAFNADYDVDRGKDAILRKPPGANLVADMSKQRGRKEIEEDEEQERLPYQDAVYSGAEGDLSMLGGKNAKGQMRKTPATMKNAVNMDRTLGRFEVEKEQDTFELDLDVERGKEMLGPRQQKGLVPLDYARPRWEEENERMEKFLNGRPQTPDQDMITKGLAFLSIKDKDKRPNKVATIDMSRQTSARDPLCGMVKLADDEVQLDLDPFNAKDPPYLRKAVKGGIISTTKRSDSPTTKYGREKMEQGNVLELDPDLDILRPRKDMGTMDMGKQVGRPPAETVSEDQDMMMTQVPVPDLLVAEKHLMPRVLGGAVGLEKKTENRILEKKHAQDSEEDLLQRQRIQQEARDKLNNEKARQAELLSKIKNGPSSNKDDDSAKLKKSNRKKSKSKPSSKGGKLIKRAKAVK